MRFLAIIFLCACVELPTESLDIGVYDGQWKGENANGEVHLQLNIQHEITSTHGTEIVGNGILFWLGIPFHASIQDAVINENKLSFLLILEDANTDGNYIIPCQVVEYSNEEWKLHLEAGIKQYIYMHSGTWNYPKVQND